MSYHVVVDIVCNRDVNLYIAKLVNSIFNIKLLHKYDIVDLGVYTNNHSIRLPGCIKI